MTYHPESLPALDDGAAAATATESLLWYDEHRSKPMKAQDMLESKYIKQSDIDDEMLVTIRKLSKVNVARDDEEPEYRWTVQFAELPKPMVLNATNIKRTAKALGDDTDGWIGGQMMLYVDPDIEFGGNIVGGLRLRAPRSPAAKAKAAIGGVSTEEINRKFQEAVEDGRPDSDLPF